MKLVKIDNGEVIAYPYTLSNLKRDNPKTSFPLHPSVQILEDYNLHVVNFVDPHDLEEIDHLTQVVEEDNKPRFDVAEGIWVIGTRVVNIGIKEAGANVRNVRNDMISATDWMAASDLTLSAEVADYRAALRAVPEQEGFPYSVDWPTYDV
tara:strand:+ start:3251 stop:3703 length:453 start_codon:yes stop_codon:yes gene_type:complete